MAHHDSIEYPQVQNDPTEYRFTAEELAEIERHAAKYPVRQSAVMPALWIAQQKWGWLSNGAMQLVADTIGMSFADVYGVATFYTMYLKENRAKHLLEICTCFTCGECGGRELYEHAKKSLRLDENGATPDKKVWVREAECLGACDSAPVVQIDNEHMRFNVKPQDFDRIAADLAADKPFDFESVPLIPQNSEQGLLYFPPKESIQYATR